MDQSLLQFFFEEEQTVKPLTVSELNGRLKETVELRFADVWVEGEIVGFTAARSGHWYFTLHDETTQIKAACFAGTNYRIRFKPQNGHQVRVRGRVAIYEAKGELQLIVDSLEPVGDGALAVAFEQIRSRLEKEGLFAPELKRPLPFFPKRVGVVTSPTGAAFYDILNVLSRRAGSVSILLVPTRVQGDLAGDEIRRAIRQANDYNSSLDAGDKLDALIVGRGGGSAEDLWAFNEESVARAIRESVIPVISAVGHEIDFTIADYAADVRAATPSAAAEMVAAKEEDLLATIDGRRNSIEYLILQKLGELRSELVELAWSPVFAEFPNTVTAWGRDVDDLVVELRTAMAGVAADSSKRLDETTARLSPVKLSNKLGDLKRSLAVAEQQHSAAIGQIATKRAHSLADLAARLDSLSPLGVLSRGFSITQKADGTILRDAAEVGPGDRLKIKLANGKLDAEVLSSEP